MPPLRRPKMAIGTVSTNITYDRHVTVFKPTDVPEQARRRKLEVQQLLAAERDKVQPSWNASSQLEPEARKACERRTRENAKYDPPLMGQIYNFRAEALPKHTSRVVPGYSTKHNLAVTSFLPNATGEILLRPRSGVAQSLTRSVSAESSAVAAASAAASLRHSRTASELPINPKLEGATPWNGSTLTSTAARLEQERLDEIARQNSADKARLLIGKRGGYVNAETRVRQALRERRKHLDGEGGEEYLRLQRTGMLNPPKPFRPKLHLATGTKPRKEKVRARCRRRRRCSPITRTASAGKCR